MKYYINGAVIISKMVCAGHGHVLGQNCKIVVKNGVKAKWHQGYEMIPLKVVGYSTGAAFISENRAGEFQESVKSICYTWQLVLVVFTL